MGEIAVDGPYTSTGIEIVNTYHLYGATGIGENLDAEPVYVTVTEPGPWGAEFGRCYDQRCEGEVPEILEYNVDYNIYEGWYILRTTALCYTELGEMRQEIIDWYYGILCEFLPDFPCGDDEPEYPEYDPNEVIVM